MRELMLRMFFQGHATAEELAEDVAGSVTRSGPSDGPIVRHYRCEDMSVYFTVAPEHLVQVIDAIEAGDLSLDDLDVLGFCLEASEHFEWDYDTPDGKRVADAIFWLANPEINYPLTPAVLGKIRHYLVTGRNVLTLRDTKR